VMLPKAAATEFAVPAVGVLSKRQIPPLRPMD
jgi:hypothetical protein